MCNVAHIEREMIYRHYESIKKFTKNIEEIIDNGGLHEYISKIYGCNYLTTLLAGRKIFIDFTHWPNGAILDERIDISQMLINKYLKKEDIAIYYDQIKCYLK